MRCWSAAAVGVLVVGALGSSAPVLGAPPAAVVGQAPTPAAPGDSRIVLASGRGYVLHTPPDGVAAGRPAMIVVHGLRSDPRDAADSTGFDDLADRDGNLVAYPEGLRRSFNAGLCCGVAAQQGVDDVAFLAEVTADLRLRGAGRTSVVGFSNGAMMAYRFGCSRPDLVDTVGAMSGTLEVPACAGPIRALHLHGADDTAVPVAGDSWSETLQAYLRPLATIPLAAPGSTITIRELEGYGHRWTEPGDEVDATEEFWRFARMAD